MKSKEKGELIMNEDDLMSSLIVLLNCFEDKITKGNKKLVLEHIEKLKQRSQTVSEYTFTATAREVKRDNEKYVAAWTDGLSVSSDFLRHAAYRLEVNKQYRITIEELQSEPKTKKTK